MIRVRLFRPRQIWLPTVWGWSLLALVSALAAAAVMRGLYPFLAVTEPVGARILIVEGWLGPDELKQAARTYRTRGYERIVTTGGPVQSWPLVAGYTSYAQMAADQLIRLGVPSTVITAVPAPASAQDRTFLSAVLVREWARQSKPPVDAVDIFSSGTHARRSRLLFRMALGPAIRVGVHAAQPETYDPSVWWRSSAGVESVIFESLGLAWVKCCFWPGPPGSIEERWAVRGQSGSGSRQ